MKQNSGFTLIELMIVVAILAIAVAIFIPACTGPHSSRVQTVQCVGATDTIQSPNAGYWSYNERSGGYEDWVSQQVFVPRPGDTCHIVGIR